jgi:uncharacterized protein YyaL (SSP411 family)
MALDRLHDYTGKSEYREKAEEALDAFAGTAPRYGMFAATYGLATLLHTRHPLQIVVTGTRDGEAAVRLDRAARLYYRLGKAVLRVTPESNLDALPRALRDALPQLHAANAQAFVCAGGTCFPPLSDPQKLTDLLAHIGAGTGAAAV